MPLTNFWKTDWTLVCVNTHFWVFLFNSLFLMILILTSLDSLRGNLHTKTNTQDTKFHFHCGKQNLQGKTVNCKDIIPLSIWKIFICISWSLTMMEISGNRNILDKKRKIYQKTSTNCSWNLFNINFWPKASMLKSAYRKLLNLKLRRNSFCLYFLVRVWKRLQSYRKSWDIGVWKSQR